MDDLPAEFNALTPKQRAFVLEYAQHRNGSAAARAAGYKGKDQTLRAIAHENLTKPHICAAIEEITRPALEEAQVSVDRIVKELAAIAFAPPEAFARVQNDKDGIVTGAYLHIGNKLTALRLLGNHLGMFSTLADQIEKPVSLNFHVSMSGEEARQKLLDYLRNRRR